MGNIRIGCQTYTWEMLGEEWKGSVDDMLDIISGAGYAGVEITNTMIGDYYTDPDGFAGALKKRGLVFASFGFVPHTSFTEDGCAGDEIARAKKGVDFVSNFPGCRLDLAGGSSTDRKDIRKKYKTMCGIYNEVGEYGLKRGVGVDFHPHSHAGSIIETDEEYGMLMEMTDDSVGWCPDSGHIVRGGLELLPTLERFSNRIRNFHFKDADENGNWKLMGEGICDFKKCLDLLRNIGYDGWVIGEEESAEARENQAASVEKNRAYLRSLGY